MTSCCIGYNLVSASGASHWNGSARSWQIVHNKLHNMAVSCRRRVHCRLASPKDRFWDYWRTVHTLHCWPYICRWTTRHMSTPVCRWHSGIRERPRQWRNYVHTETCSLCQFDKWLDVCQQYICITFFQNVQNLCLKCAPQTQTPALRQRRQLADSGINDWLVKLHPLHFDENADEKLSAVDYFQCRIFKHRIFKPQKY